MPRCHDATCHGGALAVTELVEVSTGSTSGLVYPGAEITIVLCNRISFIVLRKVDSDVVTH